MPLTQNTKYLSATPARSSQCLKDTQFKFLSLVTKAPTFLSGLQPSFLASSQNSPKGIFSSNTV